VNSTILIIDAFSTGKYLPSRIRASAPKSRIVHLQTSALVPHIFGHNFDPTDFDHDLGIYKDDVSESEVCKLHVAHVISGCETGVELADRLAGRWELPSRNLTALASSRRDKVAMQNSAAAAGLRAAQSRKVCSVEKAIYAINSKEFSLPVILKPPKSAGGDGFSICQDIKEVERSGKELLKKGRDALNNIYDSIVIQEFLCGTEYRVSAVSIDGNHYFTDIWRYHKKNMGVGRVYECDELLDSGDEDVHPILEYAKSVLTAVGITFGPSHVELMLTPDGPCLIEVASRLQGAVHPMALERSLGYDPILLAAKSFVAPDDVTSFGWINRNNLKFRQRRVPLRCVHLIASADSYLDREMAIIFLQQLDTYVDGSLSLRVDAPYHVKQTKDLFSAPGFFYLSHEDESSVERDYESFRHLEPALYKPNPTTVWREAFPGAPR
jgi:hypothetical protein